MNNENYSGDSMRVEEGQNNLFLLKQIEFLQKQNILQNEIIEKNKLLEEANRKLNEEKNARLTFEIETNRKLNEANRKLNEERNARLALEKEKMRLSLNKKQKFKHKVKPVIKFKPKII